MFTKGWLLAIACLTQLWDHLKSEHNLSYLFTSRLNQDVVENLFATVRRKGGCRDNPNAKEFRCALRMVMVADLIKPVIGTNCAPDTDKFISTLKSIGKNPTIRPSQSVLPVTKSYTTLDFGSLFLPSDAFLHFCNVCETVFREEFSDENMTRDNICYRINRAIHQQASYKELSLCETAKAKIVSTFVSVRVQYALKFKNRHLHRHTMKRQTRKLQKVTHT